MQFLVIAYDGKDEKAMDRRMAARAAHLAGVEKMKAEGEALYGVAILDTQEKMIGSVMVVEFPSRADLDSWLKVEPYVTGNVWQKMEILPCRVPPLFA
ncbi:MAG: hypothetical protein IMF11_22060 [Proteobacteria bacterium]|nr:hypothetical protein [Pseudomonadota bacterium]